MIDAIVRRLPGASRLGLKGGEGSLRMLLVRATSGSFALKLANMSLALVTSVILARLLGAAGFGAYSFALAWVNLLVIPTTLGFGRLLVREVAVYRDRSEWRLLRGLLLRANQIVLPFSIVVALVAAVVAHALAGRMETQVLYTFYIAMALLPLTALINVRRTTMQGLRRIVSGQVPESVVRPVLVIALVGIAYLVLGDRLSTPWAMAANVLATAITFLLGAVLLRRSLPQPVREQPAVYRTRAWMRGALPLLIVTGMYVINSRTDVIMLGMIAGAEATGIYTVATRGAELITFILMAANLALGPTVASLYAAGELDRLQRLVTMSSRLILLASFPLALGLILFGHWFLLVFGQEFTQGGMALAILSVGRLFSATMCAVGLLLVMTGHERQAAIGVGVGAALNVALNAALIPPLGIEGAAIATATSTVVLNLLLAVWVYRKVGIYPTAFGKLGTGRVT